MGALLFMQKASKEPILEEAELDFKPLEECEEGLEEEEDSPPKETKELETDAERKGRTLHFSVFLINGLVFVIFFLSLLFIISVVLVL